MNPSSTAPITMGNISSRGAGRTSSGSKTGGATHAPARPRPKSRDPRGAVIVRSELARSDLNRRRVKMRDLPEDFKPRVNLRARHRLQPLRAEALARERPHHAAIEHRPPKD